MSSSIPTGSRRPNFRILVASALTASVLALAACGAGNGSDDSSSSDLPGAATADTGVLKETFGAGGKDAGEGLKIPVGAVLSMSGQGSYYGEVMSQGAKLAAAQIKAAGGPDFQLSIADHRSGDIQAGIEGFRRLSTEKNAKLMLISFGAVGDALAPLISQQKVLTFQGGGPTPGQLGKDFLWNNRMLTGTSNAPGGLTWIHKQFPEAKRLAITGTKESAQYAVETLVPKIWPEITPEGSVVATEYHDVGITDYKQVIARLKAANPDVIWTTDFGDDTGYFVKQLKQSGLDVPVLGIEYTANACKIGGAAYDSNYYFAADYFDQNTEGPWAQYFVKTYNTAYNSDPDFYAANYYEAMFIYWDLVRAAIADGKNPEDPAVLQELLKTVPEFPSLYGAKDGKTGQMKADTTQHSFAKPMGVFAIKDCVPVPKAEIKEPTSADDPTSAFIRAIG